MLLPRRCRPAATAVTLSGGVGRGRGRATALGCISIACHGDNSSHVPGRFPLGVGLAVRARQRQHRQRRRRSSQQGARDAGAWPQRLRIELLSTLRGGRRQLPSPPALATASRADRRLQLGARCRPIRQAAPGCRAHCRAQTCRLHSHPCPRCRGSSH